MTSDLHFIAPLPGLAPYQDYALRALEGATGLFALETVGADGQVRLFVIDASVHAPAYQPEIDDTDASRIELSSGDDALVLLVATPREQGIDVNLAAPIVVNARTGSSMQCILDDPAMPLAAALPLAS